MNVERTRRILRKSDSAQNERPTIRLPRLGFEANGFIVAGAKNLGASMSEGERRLAAIMFTDMVDYTDHVGKE